MIIDKLPIVTRVTTVEQSNRLVDAARKDNHDVYYPTHMIEKEGEVIGYFSICSIPIVEFWMHSTKVKPIESAMMINFGENLVRNTGHKQVFITVGTNSNYYPVIEKHFGYKKIYDTVILAKNL